MTDQNTAVPTERHFTLRHPGLSIGWAELGPLAVSPDAAHLEVRMVVEAGSETHLRLHAEIRNVGSQPCILEKIRWTHPARSRHVLHFPQALAPLIYSTENFRGDYFGTGSACGDRYAIEPLNTTLEYGWSEDHAFPGVFVAAGAQSAGLLCAALTQECLHTVFRFRGANANGERFFEIEEVPTSSPGLTLLPGQAHQGETLLFALCDTNRPQIAGLLYEKELQALGRYDRRNTLNPLPAQRIWCSWNYDFFAEVTEEDILRQLPVLREEFPLVRFIQIDDGYQREYGPGSRAMIDLVYEETEAFHAEKFPSGAKGTADRIKAEGFRPAIWLALWASAKSKLVADHPDWVLQDDAGRPLLFDQWYGGVYVLDPSLEEVRNYLDHVCATVFGKWGYEGVKLDFSTFAFAGKTNRLRGGITALQARNEVLKIFRKHLPADGFFGWCVVAGTGNPLCGIQADYFRNAEDIGKGSYAITKNIARWTANTNLFLGRWPVLPNIDSIGWSADFEPGAWEMWLTLCAVSGMAVEVSGDLAALAPDRRQLISRTLTFSDPHRRLTFPDLPSGQFTDPPSIWWSQGTEDALAACFNWTQKSQKIIPSLPGNWSDWVDAWTGKPVNSGQALQIPACSAILWHSRTKK